MSGKVGVPTQLKGVSFHKGKMRGEQMNVLADRIKTILHIPPSLPLPAPLRIKAMSEFQWAMQKLAYGDDEAKRRVAYWCMQKRKKQRSGNSKVPSGALSK